MSQAGWMPAWDTCSSCAGNGVVAADPPDRPADVLASHCSGCAGSGRVPGTPAEFADVLSDPETMREDYFHLVHIAAYERDRLDRVEALHWGGISVNHKDPTIYRGHDSERQAFVDGYNAAIRESELRVKAALEGTP